MHTYMEVDTNEFMMMLHTNECMNVYLYLYTYIYVSSIRTHCFVCMLSMYVCMYVYELAFLLITLPVGFLVVLVRVEVRRLATLHERLESGRQFIRPRTLLAAVPVVDGALVAAVATEQMGMF